jgi:hypothetical protein
VRRQTAGYRLRMGVRSSAAVAAVCVLSTLGTLATWLCAAATAEWAEDPKCGFGPGVILPQPVWAFEPGEVLKPPELRFRTGEAAPPPASALTASINWGDGTGGVAPIEPAVSECYAIPAPAHTYANPGLYPVSYTVHDGSTGLDHAFAQGQVRIWDPTPRPLPSSTPQIYPSVGVPWSGVLGEFSVESPWPASFYGVEARSEPGGEPAQVTISGGHERLIVSGMLTYSRPFTGTVAISLSRSPRGLLGTWATIGVSTRASQAQVAASLTQELTAASKGARIGAMLKHGWFALAFTALEQGTAVIDWYRLPPGAKLLSAKAKPLLVASGKLTFSAAGTATIEIKLTHVGKRLLKRVNQLKLTAKGTFTPIGMMPISAERAFALKR